MTIFIFHPSIFYDFTIWRNKVHEKRNYLYCLGVSEVEKNISNYENFHSFTLAYFPIMQNGGTKNMKSRNIYITVGFSRFRKTFSIMKIFIFSLKHSF